eukprot:748596-Prymnesium_polylepis.1
MCLRDHTAPSSAQRQTALLLPSSRAADVVPRRADQHAIQREQPRSLGRAVSERSLLKLHCDSAAQTSAGKSRCRVASAVDRSVPAHGRLYVSMPYERRCGGCRLGMR